MTTKGFLVTCNYAHGAEDELLASELQIRDVGDGGHESEFIIDIATDKNGFLLSFQFSEAKQLVEALEDIISRYKK